MKYKNCIIPILIVYILFIATVSAADLMREKRMAEEIVDAIIDGDAIYLTVDEHEFLSLYTEADESKGVAIILHGRGFHPDWQDTVNPLRVGLVESGWSTLSVQMPVLEKQAKYYDYLPLFPEAVSRIDAAIVYARLQMRRQKHKQDNKVVLIAHSCGAHMAMSWIEVDSTESIDAFIGLGMGATDYMQPMKQPLPLEKINVPILDVYAENDYPAVKRMAAERLHLIHMAGNKKSDQVIIKAADHYYIDKGDELTQVIGDWLNRL